MNMVSKDYILLFMSETVAINKAPDFLEESGYSNKKSFKNIEYIFYRGIL